MIALNGYEQGRVSYGVKFASSAPSAGTAAYPSIASIHVGWRLRKERTMRRPRHASEPGLLSTSEAFRRRHEGAGVRRKSDPRASSLWRTCLGTPRHRGCPRRRQALSDGDRTTFSAAPVGVYVGLLGRAARVATRPRSLLPIRGDRSYRTGCAEVGTVELTSPASARRGKGRSAAF